MEKVLGVSGGLVFEIRDCSKFQVQIIVELTVHRNSGCLNLHLLPFAATKNNDDRNGHEALTDGCSPANAGEPPSQGEGKEISQWNLDKPKANDVDDGRCTSVTSTVERLAYDHAIGEKKIAGAKDPQAQNAGLNDFRVVCEKPD